MNSDSYKYIRYNASQESRWATVEEMKSSCSHIDLTAEDYPAAGIPIISDAREAYVDNKDTHTLIFGATGSKKTRLFCMPMINIMAKAGESFIVTDPKGELYDQTSGLVKEKGYKTVVLNFRDIGKGDMWNPLSVPYELWQSGQKDEAGMLLSDIAATFADSLAKGAKDPFWPEAAQELAIAGLYVIMEKAKKDEVNMKSFTNISTYGMVDSLKALNKMIREDSVPGMNYSSTVCTSANVTISGIVSSLFGMLRVFCVNDKLSCMLSDTTFDMKMIGREKTAVYIIVPDEKTTYHFLVTMFVKQAYEILITEAQKEKDRQLPVRVNFVLDEFCNIPKIPDMSTMISAARSRNMRYYLVVQSMHQLKGRYGEDADTIKGNCDNWVFLTSKEKDLLREISELCGSIVTADGKERRLISTSELQRFSKERGEALIMHARQYPIISALPDISQYKMFGIYPPAKMQEQTAVNFNCFSLTALLERIENLEDIAPFPSEKHLLEQAKAIYKDSLEKAGIEPPRRPRRRRPWDIDEVADEEKPPKNEAERKKKEKEKEIQARILKEKKAEGERNARARIAKLIGQEYADRFFEQRLMDESDDDDDSFLF